jgi:hypothetical protein
MIQEIARFISNETGLVIGHDLFVGHRPLTSQARCTVLLERSGGVEYFDLPDKCDWALQVLSRGATYMNARDDAMLIHALLHGAAGWTLPVVTSGDAYYLETAEAQAFPAYIGQDEKDNYEFSANYIVRVRDV